MARVQKRWVLSPVLGLGPWPEQAEEQGPRIVEVRVVGGPVAGGEQGWGPAFSCLSGASFKESSCLFRSHPLLVRSNLENQLTVKVTVCPAYNHCTL